MLHAQVCALERLHTLTLVARPKTAPRRQGLPLRAYVPRSCVCTSVPTHLESRSISEDSATTAGFGPAQMPGAGAPHLYSRSTSKTVPRRQGVRPCERVFHALVCALQRTHAYTSLYSRRASKTAPRWRDLPPASVCSTLECVRFKSHTTLFSQHVKDSATLRACGTPRWLGGKGAAEPRAVHGGGNGYRLCG